MCGRFTLRTPARDLAALFQVHELPELQPRYNIAPTQPALVVRAGPDGREATLLHWGLIPFWADDPKIGNRMINARAETVATKPSFRAAFRKRRCLIPADGFYEWQKTGDGRQPFYVHRKDDRPFAFAGRWEHWKGAGQEIESCTIIVTTANDRLKPIHDRMPVIVPEDCYDLWLDPEPRDGGTLEGLLRPADDGELEAYPVSPRVNRP